MIDPRLTKMAQVLVNYAIGIQPGDKLQLTASAVAAPLVREIYLEAIRCGAHVALNIGIEGIQEIFLKEASDEQLTYISPLISDELEFYNTTISIFSKENTKSLSGIDPTRMAKRSKAFTEFNNRWMERSASGELRWNATLYPTNGYAQDAAMTLSDFEDFVFKACLLDKEDPVAAWKQVGTEQQRIADYLMLHDEIHIVAPGTDITYHVKGRTWINADGKRNFPDGEVFSAPIEDSVSGVVQFTYPAIHLGNEVEGVVLTFREGKVVEAKASRGQDFLTAMLDMDEGSRTLGEVAFGLNYAIQRFTRNILFDEKLGGTMHMALGAAYPDSGGTNKSGLHWDMICDLRDGKVFADGQLCYENGQFII